MKPIINANGSINQIKFTINGMECEIISTSYGNSYKAIDAFDRVRNNTTGKITNWHRAKLKEITDKLCSTN